MQEQWNDFFVMVGGGAVVLAGLIFAAMSINHGVIIRNDTHKNRVINMLTGFTAIFMASGFAFAGDQRLSMLGCEWLVLWLIATVIFIRGYVYCYPIGHEFYWIEHAETCRRVTSLKLSALFFSCSVIAQGFTSRLSQSLFYSRFSFPEHGS